MGPRTAAALRLAFNAFTASMPLMLTALLTTLMASVEPAFAAQQQSSSAPVPASASAQSPSTSSSSSTAATNNNAKANANAEANVDKLPISLDRIREQLSHEPAFSVNLLHALDIPVFRTETRSDVFHPDPKWWKDNDVGNDVRPTVNQWHYDFMKMTNPNLPTGYGPGGGVDVLPGIQSVFSGIRNAFQSRERSQVRQQIREELRQINEERRKAGLPPLEEAPASPTPTETSNSTNGKDKTGTKTTSPGTSIKPTPPSPPADPPKQP